MPLQEREMVRKELERMIGKSRGLFEKANYMRLILQAMSNHASYDNLDQALRANGAAYDGLGISTSGWKMILGEIENTYFQDNSEKVLLKGLDASDIQSLITYLNERIGQS